MKDFSWLSFVLGGIYMMVLLMTLAPPRLKAVPGAIDALKSPIINALGLFAGGCLFLAWVLGT